MTDTTKNTKRERLTLADVRDWATCSITQWGEVYGVSRRTAYLAAKRGELPLIRVGKRWRVSVPAMIARLESVDDGQESA